MEINGKRYNAVTGAFLEPSASAAIPNNLRRGQSIDGFTGPVIRPSLNTTPQNDRTPHAPGIHLKAHKPEPAKTLMRTAVKKPTIKSPEQVKAQTRTDILARVPQAVVQPKLSNLSIDPKRSKKAAQIMKNPSVSRYGSAPTNSFDDSMFSSPSRPTAIAGPTKSQRYDIRNVPNIPVTSQSAQTGLPDIFSDALAKAKSHEEKYEAKTKKHTKGRRTASIITATLSLLLLVGLFAYFNVPSLSVELASKRAGFEAKLPGYSPAGYTFGDLSYGPGNVTISYRSDDSRKFDIKQELSGWDSQALLNNFVASANKAYQTYERAGRTVYFFGNNTATWVDSGIWYTVNGNNSLTKNQLLDLAGSI